MYLECSDCRGAEVFLLRHEEELSAVSTPCRNFHLWINFHPVGFGVSGFRVSGFGFGRWCFLARPKGRPLGPLGFERAQHRQTLRPSVDGTRSKALRPFGSQSFRCFGALVLWCFVLNPNEPHAHRTSRRSFRSFRF